VFRLKPCPYCAFDIENAAGQCPNCHRWLDPALDSTLNADSPLLVFPPRATNGLAIASFVCGIFWVWGIGSIAALILGYLALRQIRREPLRLRGRGLAVAGVTLGWLGVVGLALVITLGIRFWRAHEASPQRPHTEQVNLTTASVI
jgi:uncharacterized protein DUF4190